MNKKMYQNILILLLISLISACASSSKTKEASAKSGKQEEVKALIVGDIPPGSPFSKLKIGMSIKQVHDLIGESTDTHNYVTGKAFIPYYYGSDTSRLEEFYKGEGRLTFTGSGIGGVNFKLYRIVYDSSENGYNDQ